MLTASIDIRRFMALWDDFPATLRKWFRSFEQWLSEMSPEEQLTGLCVFVLVLLVLTVITPKKAKDVDASKGRQFTAALVIVMIFAFGAGWTMETGPGSLSGLFAR